jgi:hypothetical protein
MQLASQPLPEIPSLPAIPSLAAPPPPAPAGEVPQVPVAPAAVPGLPEQPPAAIAPVPTPVPTPTSTPSEDSALQGNWLKKRDWVVKAHEINDDIQKLSSETENIRKSFIEKHNVIEDAFDEFYKILGVQQGKIQELFDSVIRYLEKQKKKEEETLKSQQKKEEITDKDFFQKIDLLGQKINQLKEELEQFKLDVKSIDDLDKSLAERMDKVKEQISTVSSEAEKSATLVDSMWDMLNDKKAMAAYYDLVNIQNKIKNIQSYLNDDLTKDFDSVIDNTKKQIEKVKEGTKKLEDKGIFVKDRARRVKELKIKEIKAAEEQKKAQAIKVKQEVLDLGARRKDLPWYKNLYNYAVILVSKVYRYFSGLFSAMLGKPKTVPEIIKPPEAPVATQAAPSATTSTTVPAPITAPLPEPQPVTAAQNTQITVAPSIPQVPLEPVQPVQASASSAQQPISQLAPATPAPVVAQAQPPPAAIPLTMPLEMPLMPVEPQKSPSTP